MSSSHLRQPNAPTPLERTWSPIHHRAEPLRLPTIPTLVIAPHPDDETLLAGGLIATQRARNVPVHVLALTDGEAAYDVDDPEVLASRRRDEQLDALDELGVRHDAVTRLGLPDGSIADHIDEVAEAIERLGEFGLVVAPWTQDHHCDHEAAGAAARRAVGTSGAALLFGLFWTWHHHRPDDLSGERVMAVQLSDEARSRRARALRCHRSQFSTENGRAQLTESLVAPLGWHAEYFLAPHAAVGAVQAASESDSLLVTGVPPVTSGPSEVQT